MERKVAAEQQPGFETSTRPHDAPQAATTASQSRGPLAAAIEQWRTGVAGEAAAPITRA